MRPSIKYFERQRRNVCLHEYVLNIQGPQQKLCENFKKMLSREAFKQELPPLLSYSRRKTNIFRC